MIEACDLVQYHFECLGRVRTDTSVLGACDLVVYHVECLGRVRIDTSCVRSI